MKPNMEEIQRIDDGATFTPIEAGRLLGCTASCITQWIKRGGIIKVAKRGGRYFISGAEIKRLTKEQEEKDGASPGSTDL